MRQKQNKKPAKDGHRYVIVVPENGAMYTERLDDGVRAVCRKIIGTARVDSIPCGMDARFTVLFAVETACTAMDRYNRPASRLAQERLSGPCVVVRGERDDGLRGFSRDGAKKVMAELADMVGGDGDV
ncbi:MAG: hypothetical protein IJX14_06320 [Clostridia bacterium]|nr:hypothetical protein [Clostridia bacterium]